MNDSEQTYNKEDWKLKKQQERRDAFDMLDNATSEIAENGDTFREYLDVLSRFGKFSVSNTLLINYQNNEATYLAEFNTWNEKGVSILKGERGITLLEPGSEYIRDDGTTGFSVNVKKVFDVKQTTSEQHYPPKAPDERTVLKALLASSPCDVRMTDELDDNICCQYVKKDNAIYIKQGLTGADIFKNLSQEIIIAEFAEKGVERKDCTFIAYCASYVLCKRNGIDTFSYGFDKVPEYFQNADPKAIRIQLERIRDYSNDLSQSIRNSISKQQKEKRSKDGGAR